MGPYRLGGYQLRWHGLGHGSHPCSPAPGQWPVTASALPAAVFGVIVLHVAARLAACQILRRKPDRSPETTGR
jgi:hypothetical protein